MTDTLLREFEEWLKHVYVPKDDVYQNGILSAIEKLEELKKKYGIDQPEPST